jgi:hypothetical protein
MPPNRPSEHIADLERRTLRALCGREIAAQAWDQLTGALAEYSWQEPDHRVVYDALRGIRSRDAKARRDQLPAQATRMGFPDVDWSLYFAHEEIPEQEIRRLIRRLIAATAERS